MGKTLFFLDYDKLEADGLIGSDGLLMSLGAELTDTPEPPQSPFLSFVGISQGHYLYAGCTPDVSYLATLPLEGYEEAEWEPPSLLSSYVTHVEYRSPLVNKDTTI